MRHEGPHRYDLSKLILQPHKIVNSASKHLELTVLKQKQTTRKHQQQHKDVQALFYRYATTDNHNKPHNFKTVDGITFTSTHRKNKLHTWLVREGVGGPP